MIVLILVGLTLPFIMVATERSDIRCTRPKYTKWFITLIVLYAANAIAGSLMVTHPSQGAQTVQDILVWVILVGELIFYRLVAQRVRDAGKSRLTAYLAAIPVVGLIWLIQLAMVPSRELAFDTTLTRCPKYNTERHHLSDVCSHCGLNFANLKSSHRNDSNAIA